MNRPFRIGGAEPTTPPGIPASTAALPDILVVEDDAAFAELVAEHLRGTTATTTIAGTLAAALERIVTAPVDCVVLDLGLPDADGFEALDALFALGDPPPIVVLTGADDPDRAVEAVARGAQDYLFKRDADRAGLTRSIRYALERHRLETKLRNAEHLEWIGRLAGRVSHDFNNLLTALFGHVELARGELLAVPAASRTRLTAHVDAIDATADRAAKLTHQLLAYSRSAYVERDIVSVGQSVATLLPVVRPLLDGADVEFAASAHPDHVMINRSQLDEIITNLVRNAREALAGVGRVRILVEADAPEVRPATVRLVVVDDGPGIDPSIRTRLFDPFVTTKPSGTGLGLATVRNIVESAGGSITAESPPPGGAIFTITLPRVEPPAPAESRPLARRPAQILVVDDDDAVRKFLGIVLRQAGHEVTEVADPLHVAGLVDTIAPDLVIIDLQMPTMSGLELTERLRGRRPGLPVLTISGYSGDDVARAQLDPFITFLPKPFSGTTLRTAVERALEPGTW